MKNTYLLILIISIVLGMASCSGSDDPEIPTRPTEEQAERTVFIHMPWSSNLTSYFETNIADFESAITRGILESERVLVFFSSSPSEATLFEIKYDGAACVREELKSYSNPAFTTAAGITSILNDVKSSAPAKRYSMIIGCHGMGWIPVPTGSRAEVGEFHWEHDGPYLTRFFGGLSPEYQTDVTTLAKGISDAGIKMEYILFDDCYMSTAEVAYDLRNVTHHLIASPTEIMAYGMPYEVIAEHLVGDVDYAKVCENFLAFYSSYSMPCGTIGVTDCGEIEALAAVMKEINDRYEFDPLMADWLQRMDGYSPVIFFDYGDYTAKLCPDTELLTQFEQQLKRTVPYSAHTDSYYSNRGGRIQINTYSGITVSDPSTNSLASSKYETAWYKATH